MTLNKLFGDKIAGKVPWHFQVILLIWLLCAAGFLLVYFVPSPTAATTENIFAELLKYVTGALVSSLLGSPRKGTSTPAPSLDADVPDATTRTS